MMEFELHITVNIKNTESDISDFKDFCSDINVKPIIIIMDNVDEYQVMTSSKHRCDDYQIIVKDIVSKILTKYDILRVKVEKNPDTIKDNEFIYYESHLRVCFPSDNLYYVLNDICISHNAHLSRNAFKKDLHNVYYMCTLREYGDISDFREKVDNLKNAIISKSVFSVDKIEIEECIFDSNKSLDDKWLNIIR